MNSSAARSRSLRPVAFLFVVAIAAPRDAQADARAELDAAYAKLAALPAYRQREFVLEATPDVRVIGPIITEHVGADLKHRIVEIETKEFGRIRSERITIGGRAATKTVAPGVLAMIAKQQASLAINTVRLFIQRIVQVVAASQLGALHPNDAIMTVMEEANFIKTMAQAQASLAKLAALFGVWLPSPFYDTSNESFFSGDVVFAGKQTIEKHELLKFIRKPMAGVSGDDYSEKFDFVDPTSGLPVAEEVHDRRGKKLTRIEYYDFGAAITIELPACLK